MSPRLPGAGGGARRHDVVPVRGSRRMRGSPRGYRTRPKWRGAASNFLLSFNFAFLGATIIMWGVIVTAISIIIAIGTKHWGAGFIIVYAISVLIYDTWRYMVDSGGAVKDIVTVLAKKGGAIVALIIVVGLALAIGFIITYLAYKAGRGQ